MFVRLVYKEFSVFRRTAKKVKRVSERANVGQNTTIR